MCLAGEGEGHGFCQDRAGVDAIARMFMPSQNSHQNLNPSVVLRRAGAFGGRRGHEVELVNGVSVLTKSLGVAGLPTPFGLLTLGDTEGAICE